MIKRVATVAAVVCGVAALLLLLMGYEAANGGQPVRQCGSLLNQASNAAAGRDRSAIDVLLRQHHGNAACEDATTVQWMDTGACAAGLLVSLAMVALPGRLALPVLAGAIAIALIALAILDGPVGLLTPPAILLAILLTRSRSDSGAHAPPP